jgi:hypothetical protein
VSCRDRLDAQRPINQIEKASDAANKKSEVSLQKIDSLSELSAATTFPWLV